jgi:2-C-methyl-D-erythritol 4-phosphate cytidylyltransferase
MELTTVVRQMAEQGDQWGVVIVAAGRGTRMGTKQSKQYLPLAGLPILAHTLRRFAELAEVYEIAVVTAPADCARVQEMIAHLEIAQIVHVVPGGAERQHSVYAGLQALDTPWVLIHDAVRPLVSVEAIRRCMMRTREQGAAVLAVPVKDTIKQVDDGALIVATLERSALWSVQTPQGFERELVHSALAQAFAEDYIGTDDAAAVERYTGVRVAVAMGEYSNIKITTPEDLKFAEFLLADMYHASHLAQQDGERC